MKKYFLVKVKVETITEKGKVKKTTEQYLVSAEDVKSAESTFTKEARECEIYYNEISSISETKIIEVLSEN